jgi:UDP-2,3-diacylglucosamine pyrophosphatase LpxH
MPLYHLLNTEMTKQYKSVFISDVHLGARMSQADTLLEFLKTFECENLFLVGDIVDGWALSKSFYWPQKHNDVIQKILRRARKGENIIYLPGNHDEFLRSFGEHDFGNIRLVDNYVYTGINGKKYLVIHGDQFDAVIKKMKWLALLGSWMYDFMIRINVLVSSIRKILNLPYWSLSAWAKYKVKSAVNFIGDFETNLTDYAKAKEADGIICGHIHHANMRDINGMHYINCGDWVESLTAVVEHMDGTWELIRWNKNSV